MNHRAVFLDLDGTLVMPILVERLTELRPITGVGSAVARLSAGGFVCPVVTIQSRIAKGIFSMEEFLRWFRTFREELRGYGGQVVGPYVCPHRFSDLCECKKPSTFLYEAAAREHGIDLPRSFVIGDSADDVGAAHRFQGRGCLVRTGWGREEREVVRAKEYKPFIADSLGDAVDWILGQPERSG